MIYKKKRHIELEKRWQYFIKQKKSMFDESPTERKELSYYRIALTDDIFWRRRKGFASLMEQFAGGFMEMEEFETKFSSLYRRTRKVIDTFKTDLKKLERLQLDPRSSECQLSMYVTSIYREFDLLDDEKCSEKDVKDLVKSNLLMIQSHLELDEYFNDEEKVSFIVKEESFPILEKSYQSEEETPIFSPISLSPIRLKGFKFEITMLIFTFILFSIFLINFQI